MLIRVWDQRCRNFERLESRLNSIEGELSSLTTLLKTTALPQILPNSASTHSFDDSVSVAEHRKADSASPASPMNRRIIRGEDDQGDQYHGPGTLLSLCYELRDAVISKDSTASIDANNSTTMASDKKDDNDNRSHFLSRHDSGVRFSSNDRCTDLLERICILASFEPPVGGHEHMPIRLPPKQLLLMALPQFFSQVDYSTDIFVEAHFTANIERIYSRSSSPIDDAWAVCFNTIILLALGSENWTMDNDPLMITQFAVPLFQAMRAALRQAKFLTTPRLINVQALSLLVSRSVSPITLTLTITTEHSCRKVLSGSHQYCHFCTGLPACKAHWCPPGPDYIVRHISRGSSAANKDVHFTSPSRQDTFLDPFIYLLATKLRPQPFSTDYPLYICGSTYRGPRPSCRDTGAALPLSRCRAPTADHKGNGKHLPEP
jgi:hypothetical protein